jgi:cytochrome oxidase Cu insertion factor (SCO1/SenC/PrrC family)
MLPPVPETDDPKRLKEYLRDLVSDLNFMFEEITQTIEFVIKQQDARDRRYPWK